MLRWKWTFGLVLLIMNCILVYSTDLPLCHWDINATEDSAVDSAKYSIVNSTCTWSVRPSSSGQILVVTDIFRNISSSDYNGLQILIDGISVDLESRCLPSSCSFFGKQIDISYKSHAATTLLGFTYFAVHYSVLNSTECSTPKQPPNGRAVFFESKLGDRVVYECNSPYIGSNGLVKSEAFCIVSDFNSSSRALKASWNVSAPTCLLPQCGKIPYKVEIAGLEQKLIVNPGFPRHFTSKKARNCIWEVHVSDHSSNIIQLEVQYVQIHGRHSALMFYDGEIHEKRLILSVNGLMEGAFLTAVSDRLIIQLKIAQERYIEKESESSTAVFNISVISSPRLCPIPLNPINGHVRGSVSSRKQQQIIYSCEEGLILEGSEKSFCTEGGKWNSSLPRCIEVSDISSVSEVTDLFLGAKPHLNERPDQQNTEDKIRQWKVNKGGEESGKMPLEVDNSTDLTSAWDEYPEEEAELIEIFGNQSVYDEEEKEDEDVFPVKIAVALGIGIPAVLGILAGVSFAVYRKLYPARMSIGRKFGTYENPVYESSKKKPGRADSLLPNSSLAQGPAELQRLTQSATR